MKLTKETLEQIIKEELKAVLDEVMIKPDPTSSKIPPKFLDKFHDMLHAGELEQAQVLVDSFEGDPNYIANYIEYQKIGDVHDSIPWQWNFRQWKPESMTDKVKSFIGMKTPSEITARKIKRENDKLQIAFDADNVEQVEIHRKNIADLEGDLDLMSQGWAPYLVLRNQRKREDRS